MKMLDSDVMHRYNVNIADKARAGRCDLPAREMGIDSELCPSSTIPLERRESNASEHRASR